MFLLKGTHELHTHISELSSTLKKNPKNAESLHFEESSAVLTRVYIKHCREALAVILALLTY